MEVGIGLHLHDHLVAIAPYADALQVATCMRRLALDAAEGGEVLLSHERLRGAMPKGTGTAAMALALMAAGELLFAFATSLPLGLAGRGLVGIGDALTFLNVLRLMFSRLASHRCPNGHYVRPGLQVALMQETAVLAAPHGAGLTNMMFCREGTHVIEMADLSFPNPNFYATAAALGHHYWIIEAEGIGDVHPLEKDLRVEPSTLARVRSDLDRQYLRDRLSSTGE